jgi:hypothetical protein
MGVTPLAPQASGNSHFSTYFSLIGAPRGTKTRRCAPITGRQSGRLSNPRRVPAAAGTDQSGVPPERRRRTGVPRDAGRLQGLGDPFRLASSEGRR